MNSAFSAKPTWYIVQSIFDRVWLISENNVHMYLIEGSEKALLIDTGWGFTSLLEVVTLITTLPVTVINTHGHPDHVGGNYQFKQVLIHEKDVPLAKNKASRECRLEELERFKNRPLPKNFSSKDWLNSGSGNLVPFMSPFTIDLGERVIDIIELPGHTAGSVCIYDHKEKLLFTGDSICKGNILLHFDNSPPLCKFLTSLERLTEKYGDIKFVLPAHNSLPLTSIILEEFKVGVKRVLSGETIGVPHTTFLGSRLLAKFDFCSFLYNKNNLF